MHSKFLIIDEKIASIGTANLDFRSFHLNFEVTTLLYLDPSISKLISDFEQDLTESDLILLEDWQKRKYYRRWLEAYAKLFSPML
jgi:cardiolipin synthase